MSSGYAPKWKRKLQNTPLMFKCPSGNYHWRWSKLCICSRNINNQDIYFRIYENCWANIGNYPRIKVINK